MATKTTATRPSAKRRGGLDDARLVLPKGKRGDLGTSDYGKVRITLVQDGGPGKKFTKFSTGDWVPGRLNATVYVPNEEASSVTSITVTVQR
jgi:hypothetical protein